MTSSDEARRERRVPRTNLPISIIEDDVSVREAIVGLMQWLGLKVRCYSSAVEFLASPKFAGSSCIITDVQMPEMTGIELHCRLKALGYKIPTILITAYPNDEARARALADGVICYLTKPFDKDALIGCVRAALQLKVTRSSPRPI